ncbi:MAG: extracellular solute-binding protein [Clostridiales bacterium]|nr:extracellular solute-binding protein [Clostridiales bacterium]
MLHPLKKIVVVTLLLAFCLSAVTVLAQEELALPIAPPETVELTYMGSDSWCPNVSFKDGLPVQTAIEEATGIKINWDVYSSDLELVIQTRLAAGINLPDITEIPPFDSTIGVYRYASNGVLVPLNDLIEEHAPNIQRLFEKYPSLKAACTSPDGNIYALAGWWGDINEVVPDYIMIRQDWLKKLNLEMPVTPEQWYDTLCAFRDNDPNGNGEKDEVPVVTLNLLASKFFMTGFGFPTNSDWWLEEGKTVYYPVDARYKDFLGWLNKLYSEGLISTDIEGSQRQQVVAQDRAGVYCHDPSDWLVGFDTLCAEANPDCDYVFTPMIRGEGQEEPQLQKRNSIWRYFGITKDCKNPVEAIKWIDFCYASDQGQMLYGYGVEGLSYNLVEGKPVFTDLILQNETYDPFLALRSIGSYPSYLINDPAQAYLDCFKGTKVETVGNEYKGKMVEPFPTMLGTQEESDLYSEIWPDLQTYLEEMFINFVTGSESLDNFDSYVQAAYSMGLDEIIAIKEAQHQRYLDVVQ